MYDTTRIPPGGLRPPVKKAIDCVIERIDTHPYTAINIAPRVGKSDVCRALALAADSLGVELVLVLSPWTLLVQQLADAEKMKAFLKRINHQTCPPFCTQQKVDTRGGRFDVRNREVLVSSSYDFALVNQENLLRRIQSLSGRVIIIGDEAHTAKNGSERAKLNRRAVDCGAHVVNMTGTAFAHIDGFELNDRQTDDMGFKVIKNIREDKDGRRIGDLVTYEGQKSTFVVEGHVNFTNRDAWNADYICSVDMRYVELFGEVDEVEVRSSTMRREDLRRRRVGMLKHPKTIEGSVNELHTVLRARKAVDPNAKALVFTVNDLNASTANEHAKMVHEAIVSRGIYSSSICTLKGDSSDEKADRLLEAFACGVTGEAYRSPKNKSKIVCPDVLIVKAMGGVGMDVPELKVVMDLSNVRTPETCGQRWLRGATLHPSMTTFDLILVDEPDVRDLAEVLITSQGGDAPRAKESSSSPVDSEVVEVKEGDQLSPFEINQTKVSSLFDSEGNNFFSEKKVKLLDLLFQQLPELSVAGLTRASVGERMDGVLTEDGEPIVDQEVVVQSTDDELNKLSDQCVSTQKSIVKQRGVFYTPDESTKFVEAMKLVMTTAMELAHVEWVVLPNGKKYGMDKKYRHDLREWRRYQAALLQMESEGYE